MRIRYWSADVCSSDLAAVAKVADAAQQQGLLEAIPIQQAERRGPVTLERPAVRVVRSSGREIQLASAAPSRDTARPAITVTPTRRTGTSLAMANASEVPQPARVNVIRADGEANVLPDRPNYPIRIRLGAPKPAE